MSLPSTPIGSSAPCGALAVLLLLVAFHTPADAQDTVPGMQDALSGTIVEPLPGETAGTIEGTVHDSVAGAPLVDATVLLLGSGRNALSDTEGRFVLSDVTPGLHALTFFHPQLEALGIGTGGWSVQVSPGDTVSVHLAIPSPAGIAAVLCEGDPAVLVGFLEDAGTGQPLPGGTVEARWGDGPEEVTSAPADATGRYVLCGLPPDRTLRVHGTFLGIAGVERRVRVGGALALHDVQVVAEVPATLRGRVRSLETGAPVREAVVRLSGEDRNAVLTDPEGRFTLGSVAPGSRLLEVEHLSFGLHRDSVRIVPGADLRLEIEVPTQAFELEGIEVTAERRYRGHLAGFENRMQRGFGSYVTRDVLERTGTSSLSTLIATRATGFRLACSRTRCTVRSSRRMRSLMGGDCPPEIWIDGMYMWGGFDLEFFHPSQVEAIETYDSPATIPPRFRTRNAGCGVIAVWTRVGGR